MFLTLPILWKLKITWYSTFQARRMDRGTSWRGNQPQQFTGCHAGHPRKPTATRGKNCMMIFSVKTFYIICLWFIFLKRLCLWNFCLFLMWFKIFKNIYEFRFQAILVMRFDQKNLFLDIFGQKNYIFGDFFYQKNEFFSAIFFF